ncbi:MAG: ABC transporter permease [Nitrospinae bacterium]|nr:ABC transporter permease [Nitrospinota bacterium]
MFERIRMMVVKEFIQVFRDTRMKFFIFGAPILQTIVFGYAVTLDVNNVATAVCDMDRSYESRELVRRMESSGYFRIVDHAVSPDGAQRVMEKGNATLAVIVPSGFSKDIKRTGEPATVQLLADGTDSNSATIAIGYASLIISGYSAQMGAGAVKVRPAIVDLKVRAWYNPELRSRNYNVPGVIAIIVMLISLLLTSMAVVREKEIGTMEQLMVTPLKPVELILGKTIPFAMIGFADMFFVTAVAVHWYQIPIKGSILLLTFFTAIYLLSSLSLGLFLSTIAKTQQQAMMATFLIFAPAVLLSGFMFPVVNMPGPVQIATLANPLRHFLVLIRGVFLKGMGLDTLWPNALALFALGCVFMTLATMRFKKKLG